MDYKAAGQKAMNELNGENYGEEKAKLRNSFNDVLHDYAEEVCFGMVWSRPGIDKKLRSVLNIALLTALNRPHQLRNHIRNALRGGLTAAELKEILLHTAVYAGLPAAGDAFKIAEEVLRERGELG